MTSPSSQNLYAFLKDRVTEPNSSTDRPSPESPEHTTPPEPFLDFDSDDIGEKLRQANREQLNNADFGIIKVDDQGHVEFYNRYESELSGVAPEDAQGRNFFTHLAPCSNNRIFQGRFTKGVRSGTMDERFTYTFTYMMRPTLVDVRLYRDSENNNWVMVQQR